VMVKECFSCGSVDPEGNWYFARASSGSLPRDLRRYCSDDCRRKATRKPGRPRVAKADRRVGSSISLAPSTWRMVDKIAAYFGDDRSGVIERAILFLNRDAEDSPFGQDSTASAPRPRAALSQPAKRSLSSRARS
jgi:hypothetical protein